MTFDLQSFQKQPTSNWGHWLIQGGRGTGKSTALHIAAGERARAGEHVLVIDPWIDAVRGLGRVAGTLYQHEGDADWRYQQDQLRFESGGTISALNPRGYMPAFLQARTFETVMLDDVNTISVVRSDAAAERRLHELLRNLRRRGTVRWAEVIVGATDTGVPKTEHTDIPTTTEE